MNVLTVARVVGVICVGALAVLSLIPGADVPRTGAPHAVEHFIAYAITALVLGLAYRDLKVRLNLGLALILFAGLMEIAQFWALSRGPNVSDWLAGAIGVGAGFLAAATINHFILNKSLQEG